MKSKQVPGSAHTDVWTIEKPRAMRIVSGLALELECVLGGDLLDLQSVLTFLEEPRGPKRSKRIVQLVVSRYLEDSSIRNLVIDLVQQRTLQDWEIWTKREEESGKDFNRWIQEIDAFNRMGSEVSEHEKVPQLLPFWIGETLAEDTWGTLWKS